MRVCREGGPCCGNNVAGAPGGAHHRWRDKGCRVTVLIGVLAAAVMSGITGCSIWNTTHLYLGEPGQPVPERDNSRTITVRIAAGQDIIGIVEQAASDNGFEEDESRRYDHMWKYRPETGPSTQISLMQELPGVWRVDFTNWGRTPSAQAIGARDAILDSVCWQEVDDIPTGAAGP